MATVTAQAGADVHGEDIPAAANVTLTALVVAAHLLCGLALPLALLPASPWWLLLLVPFALSAVTHWALVHESVHGHLHPRRAVNEGLGRLLSVLFGAPFAALRCGHLAHHTLNSRPSERAEIYDPARTPRWRANLQYYLRLCWGPYLAEILSAVLCFLPRRHLTPLVRRVFFEGAADAPGAADRAERQLLAPGRLARLRLDGGLALAWLAACLLLYGAYAWAFGLAVLGRGLVVSFMDNAPHYAGELGDAGQGHDTRAARLAAPVILNTNLHGTHHRHPNLPWTALPRAFAADGSTYAGGYLTVPLRQLGGPIPHRGLDRHGAADDLHALPTT